MLDTSVTGSEELQQYNRVYCPDQKMLNINMLFFYVLLTVHLGIILFNDQLDVQFITVYVYFNSLHVSSIKLLIIRRFNCISRISGICHSDRLVRKFGRSVQTCIPDGHLHRMTYTRYRIDTIESPDDEHLNARNM